MKVLKCSDLEDLNPRCPFEWRGDSEDEILNNAAEHIILWHRPRNIPDVLWKARTQSATKMEEYAAAPLGRTNKVQSCPADATARC